MVELTGGSHYRGGRVSIRWSHYHGCYRSVKIIRGGHINEVGDCIYKVVVLSVGVIKRVVT